MAGALTSEMQRMPMASSAPRSAMAFTSSVSVHSFSSSGIANFRRWGKMNTIIHRAFFGVGTAWALAAWPMWAIGGHRGCHTAMLWGIILAPSYLLVSTRSSYGLGMRAFIGTAVVILAFAATTRGDPVIPYLILPPLIALISRIIGHSHFRKQPQHPAALDGSSRRE